ncbi:hypothetical protein [Streptomyces sp. NPDC006997]|uniref:hypothetical protein n=1 Tax=Streptomyces sp. NPDC006997 TaxID=3155356 RepID=UPI003407E28C
MTVSERDEAPRVVPGFPDGVSMRDLLASCAAADLISRPPRDPEPYGGSAPVERAREAA